MGITIMDMTFNGTKGCKNGYNYVAYLPYYPTRFSVERKLEEVRKIIWNFKDGRISTLVAEALAQNAGEYVSAPHSDWHLCVVPASTSQKTIVRFKEFCEKFCELTGIINGYNLISNLNDREAKHTQEDRNSIDILSSMDFSTSIRGKKILLFDDIYTTGKTFSKVTSKLDRSGAKEIRGLFLGKTHWLDE